VKTALAAYTNKRTHSTARPHRTLCRARTLPAPVPACGPTTVLRRTLRRRSRRTPNVSPLQESDAACSWFISCEQYLFPVVPCATRLTLILPAFGPGQAGAEAAFVTTAAAFFKMRQSEVRAPKPVAAAAATGGEGASGGGAKEEPSTATGERVRGGSRKRGTILGTRLVVFGWGLFVCRRLCRQLFLERVRSALPSFQPWLCAPVCSSSG